MSREEGPTANQHDVKHRTAHRAQEAIINKQTPQEEMIAPKVRREERKWPEAAIDGQHISSDHRTPTRAAPAAW